MEGDAGCPGLLLGGGFMDERRTRAVDLRGWKAYGPLHMVQSLISQSRLDMLMTLQLG